MLLKLYLLYSSFKQPLIYVNSASNLHQFATWDIALRQKLKEWRLENEPLNSFLSLNRSVLQIPIFFRIK